MANPFGFASTYVPQFQQNPLEQSQGRGGVNPFANAQGMGPMGIMGTGAAQTQTLGTEKSPQEFANTVSDPLNLQKNFDNNFKFDPNVLPNKTWSNNSKFQSSDEVLNFFQSGQKSPWAFNQTLGNANLPGYKYETRNNYSFDELQGAYSNVLNNYNALEKLAGDRMDPTNLQSLRTAKEQLMKRYLEVYNQWGNKGAFGLNFVPKTIGQFTF